MTNVPLHRIAASFRIATVFCSRNDETPLRVDVIFEQRHYSLTPTSYYILDENHTLHSLQGGYVANSCMASVLSKYETQRKHSLIVIQYLLPLEYLTNIRPLCPGLAFASVQQP